MKGTVKLLICDSKPNSNGETVNPEGIRVPDGELAVTFEAGPVSIPCGKAKIRFEANVVYADVILSDVLLPKPSPCILYPRAEATVVMADKVVKVCDIRGISISIAQNVDERIGTLQQQGIE